MSETAEERSAASSPPAEAPGPDPAEELRLTFTEHLAELRARLIRCAWAVLICFGVAYAFREELFHLLLLPLLAAMPEQARKMHFTGLVEPFFVYLKISLIVGVFGASPVILYQLWRFIAPGLYRRERRAVLPFVVVGSVFFLGGASFGYFLVFPYGFRFLMSFAGPDIEPILTIGPFLSLASKLLLAFGLVFELPLFLLSLTVVGLVDTAKLRAFRKYFVVVAFIFGAVITPPDVVTQVMLAIPLMVLYELGVLLSHMAGRRKA